MQHCTSRRREQQSILPNAGYKETIVSPKAKLNTIKISETYLYDFRTEAGKEYTLVSME